MSSPLAIVTRTAGTNCDAETVRALELAGARVELIHIHQLLGDWVMFTQRAQDRVSATNGQSGCTDNLGCFQFEVLGYFNDGDPLTFDFLEGGLPAVKNQHGVRQRSNRELATALSPRWLRASNSIGVGPWRRLKFDP